MSGSYQHLEALQDIRKMMQRSSRFISLSGLSGIAAGIWGLVGAWLAGSWIQSFYEASNAAGISEDGFHRLKLRLFLLAATVLCLSLLCAFYFTWRRAGRNKLPLWDHTSKMLAVNLAIPLVAGGLFILAMLQHDEWRYIAPACLLFYGLALVNGSKYTLSDIRYLGISEVVLGLANTQFLHYGLYFWAVGFGLLHIIYGFVMWWKNERPSLSTEQQ